MPDKNELLEPVDVEQEDKSESLESKDRLNVALLSELDKKQVETKLDSAKVVFQKSADNDGKSLVSCNDGRTFTQNDDGTWTMKYRAGGQDKSMPVANLKLDNGKLTYDVTNGGKELTITETPDGSRMVAPTAKGDGAAALKAQTVKPENEQSQVSKGSEVASRNTEKNQPGDSSEEEKERAAIRAKYKVETEQRSDGTKARQVETSPDGTVRIETTYGADGETATSSKIFIDGEKFRETTFRKDGTVEKENGFYKGQLHSERLFDKDGKPVSETVYWSESHTTDKIKFDKDGNKATIETIDDRTGKTRSIETRNPDGTSKTVDYDENGKVSRESIHDANHKLLETTSIYRNGELVEKRQYKDNEPISETSYKYENGKPISGESRNLQTGNSTKITFENGVKTGEVEYGKDYRRVRETSYHPNGEVSSNSTYKDGHKDKTTTFDDKKQRTSETSYDQHGLKQHETAYKPGTDIKTSESKFDRGSPVEELVYAGDGKRVVKQTLHDFTDEKGVSFSKAVNEFDENGKRTSMSTYFHDGRPRSKELFDEKQQRTSLKLYDTEGNVGIEWDYKDGVCTRGISREYYKGRQTSETISDGNGQKLSKTDYYATGGRLESSYKDGRLSTSVEIGEDGKTPVREKRFTGRDELKEDITFQKDGKTPATRAVYGDDIFHNLKEKTTYRANGKPDTVETYDERGQKVQEQIKFDENGKGGVCKKFDKDGHLRGEYRVDSDGKPAVTEDPDLGPTLELPDGRKLLMDHNDRPPDISDVAWKEKGWKANHFVEGYITDGGVLSNNTDKPVAYIAKDTTGTARVFVLPPGHSTPKDADVDAFITDEKYTPVMGPDGKYHPVYIPPSEVENVKVTKVSGGTKVTLTKEGWKAERNGTAEKLNKDPMVEENKNVKEFTGGGELRTMRK